MKSQATDWGEIFANHISDKKLYLEYIKNSQKSTISKQTQLRV